MKKLLLVCVLIFFCGCRKQANHQISQSIGSVQDFRGKTIAVQKPVKRVVCLLESALSGIYMLNAQDRVVGISSNIYSGDVFGYYSLLDERIKAKSLPTPGNWDFVSIESVISLQPDLVILWASQREAIENLESYNIPVYAVMLNGIDDVYKEIHDFGVLFQTTSRADNLIQYTKNEIFSVHSQVSSPEKVYFMWSQGILETSGTKSTVNEMIQAAGCVNVCPSSEEHLTINIERLLEWNPDMIVMWCNEKLDPLDIMNNPTLKDLHAVQAHNVYELPSVFECDMWTLKFQYVVKLLAKSAYPLKYATMNLQTEKAQMLNYLYRQNIVAAQ